MEYFVMIVLIVVIASGSIGLFIDFKDNWYFVIIILLSIAGCVDMLNKKYENGYKQGAVDVLENKIEWKKGEKGWEKVGLKPEVDTVYVIVQDTCKHN